VNNDPLAKFRREPRPASNDGQAPELLTEHEALGRAISALSQTPNVYLGGDYSDSSEFIAVLKEAYEPRPASNDGQAPEPLTEHEALGQAISALNQTPNVHLGGDYSDSSEFTTVLKEAYERGTVREAHERTEEENLAKGEYENERRKWIGVPLRAFADKSAPEPEETRKVDIDMER